MIKWHAAVCEAQGSPKGPKLMIKGIKEAQRRLREAQGTEKALKGITSVLEAGLTPTSVLAEDDDDEMTLENTNILNAILIKRAAAARDRSDKGVVGVRPASNTEVVPLSAFSVP